MMKKMIVRNISKEFKGGFGIKKISFEVNAGDIVGFIGDNGMGKTTTIKSILGELKIQSGDVIIDGEKISQFAQRVAFLSRPTFISFGNQSLWLLNVLFIVKRY
jgi:ABC-type multidrug transport system ATPase subunit